MNSCQFCANEKITEILYLGAVPPVNDMHAAGEEQNQVNYFPLPFCHCEECGLTQIGLTLDREIVFPRTYPYLTGMTKSLIENFVTQAQQVNSYLKLTQEDLVVDIGSNDGSLLKQYLNFSKVLGIEPTQAADVAINQNIPTLNTYFDANSVETINERYGKARLITACNVFAHIGDISGLLSNIEKIIAKDGVFISESHYLLNLVETLQFDTIYHEHLRYYTVTFLKTMFNSFGFDLFRVDPTPSHGGSIRVWACLAGQHPIMSSVQEFLEIELESEITSSNTLQKFAQDVISWRNNFRGLLSKLIADSARIGALGAPSRASTLLTFAGLTELDLIGVGEVPDSAKIGKFMPGTRIEVMSENQLLSLNPTHLLILSWHIKEPIMKALRKKGYQGSFIIPLPVPQVVN